MRSAGLTLLELIVGVALSGILAAAAVTGYADLDRRWRLESGVRQLALDLRMVRIGAIAEARAHRLRFVEGSGSYQPESRRPSGTFVASSAARHLPRGVRVASCSARGDAISFQPRGNAGTFGSIAIVGPDSGSRRIAVDIAGRVRVE